MRFASLGSGSRGNAMVVEAGATRLLLDCGFGLRDVSRRLESVGIPADSLDAVLVTHEHGDHVGGVFALARRHALPVFLTYGTRASVAAKIGGAVDTVIVDGHAPFFVCDLHVQPFTVPHDAREPVQYVFSDGVRRLGVLTDAGSATPHIAAMLDAVDALVIECNHDAAMLAASVYPASLKRRISGPLGHLDNATAASLLASIDSSRLQHIVAAHLSEQNNRPELAASALAEVLGCAAGWIAVATQDDGFAWRQIS